MRWLLPILLVMALYGQAPAVRPGPAAAGDAQQGLEKAARAYLGKPSRENRRRFEEAWSRVNGEAAPRAYLDARYREWFPNPVQSTRYKATAGRSGRVVLLEAYAGSGCGPCVAADLALEGVLTRYSRDELAVVVHHQHIPRPDPLANNSGEKRWRWQGEPAVPTIVIDGMARVAGGGGRGLAQEVYGVLTRVVDGELEVQPRARLELEVSADRTSVTAKLRVPEAPAGGDLALHCVLVEKTIAYSGENGIRFHPMVERNVAAVRLNDVRGQEVSMKFALAAIEGVLAREGDDFDRYDEKQKGGGSLRFMEKHTRLDAAGLGVVAFVQDMRSRAVLGAVYRDAVLR